MRVSANAPQMLTSRVSVQQVHKTHETAGRPPSEAFGRGVGSQAHLRRGGHLRRASGRGSTDGAIALAIRLSSRGPIAIPASTRHEGRSPLHHLQVPDHGRRSRRREGRALLRSDAAVLQVDRRPSVDEVRRPPPLLQPRRAAAALERRPRRHEPRRAAPVPGEQVEANPDLLGPRHDVRAGHHRLVAGQRAERGRVARRPSEWTCSTSRTGRSGSTSTSS